LQKARNTIEDPARLQHLVQLIDETQWHGLRLDVTGAIYEELLGRNAQEVAEPSPSAIPPAAPAASCSPPTRT